MLVTVADFLDFAREMYRTVPDGMLAGHAFHDYKIRS